MTLWQAAGALLLALLIAAGPAAAGERGSTYRADGRCGPYPRLPLRTPEGLCVGLVAGPADGLEMPRTMVEIAPGRFLLADMGGWGRGMGRILSLSVSGGASPRIETLHEKLDVPHGLAIGPDGLVYVGEQDEIWRFDPLRPKETRERVLDDFPHEGLHRLKVLLFDRDGSLIVNLGAITDRCERANGRVRWPCPADAWDAKEAALWRITFERPGGKVASFEPIAQGLRNSVALALHPASGLLLQGENNIDLADPDGPPEELNVIRPRAHYGWPYCTGMGETVPDYAAKKPKCGGYERPAALLPAHAAPLAMLYEPADGLPGLAGRLIVTLHGFRATGQRVIACEVDAGGVPVAAKGSGMARCENVISGWSARAGVRPKGAPVGLLRASDGTIWLTDDKNRTVMVLMQADGGTGGTGGGAALESAGLPEGELPAGWASFHGRVLKSRCASCHDFLRTSDPEAAWKAVGEAGWSEGDEPRQWLLIRAMLGEGVRRPMPPPAGFAKGSKDAARLAAFIAALQE